MSRHAFRFPRIRLPHPHRHSGSSPPAPGSVLKRRRTTSRFLRKHPAPLPMINVWQAALSARPRPPRSAAPAVPGQIGTSPTGFPANLPVRTDRKASFFPQRPAPVTAVFIKQSDQLLIDFFILFLLLSCLQIFLCRLIRTKRLRLLRCLPGWR